MICVKPNCMLGKGVATCLETLTNFWLSLKEFDIPVRFRISEPVCFVGDTRAKNYRLYSLFP
jgi:hypothetical protein